MDPISLYARDREKRAVGRALRLALIASVALAGVLLALLATASANTALFERHYPLLLWGNAAIGLALALLTAELLLVMCLPSMVQPILKWVMATWAKLMKCNWPKSHAVPNG